MKKTITIIVLFFGFSCFCQGSMSTGEIPPEGMKPDISKKMSTEELLSKMTSELKLDELQELQVREVLIDMEKHTDVYPNKIKSGARPTFEEIKEKMETNRKMLTAKLTKILTEEQLKKWNQESDNWKPDNQ